MAGIHRAEELSGRNKSRESENAFVEEGIIRVIHFMNSVIDNRGRFPGDRDIDLAFFTEWW